MSARFNCELSLGEVQAKAANNTSVSKGILFILTNVHKNGVSCKGYVQRRYDRGSGKSRPIDLLFVNVNSDGGGGVGCHFVFVGAKNQYSIGSGVAFL